MQVSTGHHPLPDDYVARDPSGNGLRGSPTALSLLFKISSITQPTPQDISKRTHVPTETPEELEDSGDEDSVDRDEPDDHSINDEVDFQRIDCIAEEAQMDRVQKFV